MFHLHSLLLLLLFEYLFDLCIISTLNKVTQIVANSNFTSSLVKDIGITNQNITCIYPGALNTNHLNEEIISNIKGQPVITTLARLEKRKGHAYILSVIAKLKSEYPNILYVIAGSGVECENLKKISSELDIEKNVISLGGGGLIAGTSTYLKEKFTNIKSYSVEPFGFEDTKKSLNSGKILPNEKGYTSISDSLFIFSISKFL